MASAEPAVPIPAPLNSQLPSARILEPPDAPPIGSATRPADVRSFARAVLWTVTVTEAPALNEPSLNE